MENLLDFNNLVKKLKEGTITNDEIAVLLEYLKESEPGPEMESIFQKAWAESAEISSVADSKWLFDMISSKTDRIFNGVEEEVPGRSEKDKLSPGGLKRYIIPLLRYAAVLILGFSLFYLVRPFTQSSNKTLPADQAQIQRIIVPYGSKSKVELPDGSLVTLNSGSNLSYSSGEFNTEKRTVLLEGEGFFHVKEDIERPFYVKTRGIKVKVLGTTFNLKAYPDEDQEEMVLLTGSVEIYLGSDRKEELEPIILKPNEKAVFIRTEQKIRRHEVIPERQTGIHLKLRDIKFQSDQKTEQIVSWKDDRMIFDNESFSSLVAKIERWYDVRITVNYPELNSARFSGKFDNETVEQVMSALAEITPFGYEIRKNQITITKK